MYYKGDRSYKEQNAFGYPILFRYLNNKVRGKEIAEFFRCNQYRSVSIYGLGLHYNLGELLYEDIKHTDIEVKYFIDKYLWGKYPDGISGIPVVSPQKLPYLEPVDVIVITPVFYSNEIMDELTFIGIEAEKIITLTDIVYGL